MSDFKVVFRFLALLSVLCLGLFITGFVPLAGAAVFNNVQISIQTSSLQVTNFMVDAFNMSGYLEASVQTHFAAASFELPSGQYIFTVTANSGIYYPVPLMGATSSGQTSPSGSSMPIYVAPAVEYGYSVQQVSSSIAISIVTQNVTQFPTNSLSVTVTYSNGTAASGAYVSASVLGSYYYWGYETNVVTWATTGADGVVTLTVPTAPVFVDAWSWVLSKGTSYPTPQPGAPSQVANGAIIPVPIYLGLAGSAVVIPPQTAVAITLQPQSYNYWVSPGVGTSTPTLSSSSSSYSAGPGSVPITVYEQQQGNPNLQNLQVPVSTTTPTYTPTPTPSPLPPTPTSSTTTPPAGTPTSSPSPSASTNPQAPEFPTIILTAMTLLFASIAISYSVLKSKRATSRLL